MPPLRRPPSPRRAPRHAGAGSREGRPDIRRRRGDPLPTAPDPPAAAVEHEEGVVPVRLPPVPAALEPFAVDVEEPGMGRVGGVEAAQPRAPSSTAPSGPPPQPRHSPRLRTAAAPSPAASR